MAMVLATPVVAQKHAAADLGKQVAMAGLDMDNCYRVRDIEITRDEVRISLTEGYLMFGKPVNGQPLTAVFSRRYRWWRWRNPAAASGP